MRRIWWNTFLEPCVGHHTKPSIENEIQSLENWILSYPYHITGMPKCLISANWKHAFDLKRFQRNQKFSIACDSDLKVSKVNFSWKGWWFLHHTKDIRIDIYWQLSFAEQFGQIHWFNEFCLSNALCGLSPHLPRICKVCVGTVVTLCLQLISFDSRRGGNEKMRKQFTTGVCQDSSFGSFVKQGQRVAVRVSSCKIGIFRFSTNSFLSTPCIGHWFTCHCMRGHASIVPFADFPSRVTE